MFTFQAKANEKVMKEEKRKDIQNRIVQDVKISSIRFVFKYCTVEIMYYANSSHLNSA